MADPMNFTAAFDTMHSNVYIVTSSYRRKPAGCTAVWINRASFDPPLVSVHMQPKCHTMDTIRKGKRLCINVLDNQSLLLARRFGFSSGWETDKFADVPYKNSLNGSPVLEAAVSYIDCKLKKEIPVGDHILVIAEVMDAAVVREDSPLLYDPNTFYPSLKKRVEKVDDEGHSEAETT